MRDAAASMRTHHDQVAVFRLRDLGSGWYWFETGSTERSIWFDG